VLNIYYAREDTDKDRFLYERINGTLLRTRNEFDRAADGPAPDGAAGNGGRGSSACEADMHNGQSTGERDMYAPAVAVPGRVLLVVPEQYSLQAELDAMDSMGVDGFLDLDVLSMTSLGRRVLADVGGGADAKNFIDQYGKIMLITKLLHEHAGAAEPTPKHLVQKNDAPLEHADTASTRLRAFKAPGPSAALASHISDMISELKNFNISPDELEVISAKLGDNDLLGLKLSDIALIYRGFEEELSGKLLDTADHLKRFTEKIHASSFIASSEIWLSGYDYLSPAMREAIIELSKKSLDTNIVLTADPGDPFFSLTNNLSKELAEAAGRAGVQAQNFSIDGFERDIPTAIKHIERHLFASSSEPFSSPDVDAITLTTAAGFYAEAETAASRICDLVRDEGLRYRDILVLCNDMQTRAPILKRVFGEYGIPVFIDQRRAVDHDPIIELLIALPNLAANGRKYEDVFHILKTGLAGIDADAVSRLENYAIEYRIRGSMWDKEFTRGEYSDEEMLALNEARAKVSALLSPFEKSFRRSHSAREKTECIADFLTNSINLTNQVQSIASQLEASGNLEYAAELIAIEDVAVGVLDQLSNALGDAKLTAREYANCLSAGLNSVRVGMLPTSTDQIVIGTMQRTRSSEAEAVFVLGANDGILPAAMSDEGILNSDEKQRLENSGDFLGRSDETVYFEEQLAIYRNLSKSSKKLYISCAAFDIENKELRPSNVFLRLRKLFPNVPVTKDIISEVNDAEDPLALVQYPDEALVHLSNQILDGRARGQDELHAPWTDVYRRLESDSEYSARIGNMKAGLNFKAGRSGREHISPNTLNELMRKTISPSAIENYSRCPFSWFIGNALRLRERRVHELDYRSIGDIYHELLMRYGERINRESAWDSITREECEQIIREDTDNIAQKYREDLVGADYHTNRIAKVASEVAWAVTGQVRDSDISKMLFESAFDGNSDFSPIKIAEELSVSGRIDRVDIRSEGSAIITDYKSGNEKFSPEDVRGGWQLQLLIYLLAVTGSGNYRAGGINYLGITEPRIEDKGDDEKNAADISKQFKPDGLFAIGQENTEQLTDLMDSVRSTLSTLAKDMLAGEIHATPKTAKKIKAGLSNTPRKACTYCLYKGVCGYIG
jgi:ATP-dependent helicase/nuclease subunit B